MSTTSRPPARASQPPERFSELGQFEIDPASVRLLPLAFCERHQVVVLGRVSPDGTAPVPLGMLRPEDERTRLGLESRWNRRVIAVRLNRYEIRRAIATGYPESLASAPGDEPHALDLDAPAAKADATATELVDDMLAEAVRRGASDLHLEHYDGDVDVRVRVDGMLNQLFTHVSPDSSAEVVQRLKILARLDIAERRRVQEGRFRCVVATGGARRTIDFRVSVVPGVAGEDVAIRVLDWRPERASLDALGLSNEQRRRLASLLANPEGLVIVTGPTGSGKTTTLYAALQAVNDHSRKIVTAEDPVEHELPKVNQKEVGPTLSMAELARAFLRHDPDVVLVGEIRDPETARAAADAASTGHLVLTTLHTADALGTIPRLRGLGLRPDQIANALLAVVAQRLVRRICEACRVRISELERSASPLGRFLPGLAAYRGEGCDACEGSGYVGRTGIYELLVVDEKLQDLIADGASTTQLREHLAVGAHTLLDDALDKVEAGITTLDEIVRTVPWRVIARASREPLLRPVEDGGIEPVKG